MRQIAMLRDFRFKCYCEACTNNYKTLNDVPSSSGDLQFVAEILQELPRAEVELELIMHLRYTDSISKVYDRACKYMDKYGTKNYSVHVICYLNFFMVNCLTISLECQADLNWK